MSKGYLFDKRGAIFLEIPPFKYLGKVIIISLKLTNINPDRNELVPVNAT